MKRLTIVLLAALFFSLNSFAQRGALMIHSDAKGLYLEHQILKGQTYYALGRKYKLEPETIAAYNGLSVSTPLSVKQVVKIPLSTDNFSQSDITGSPVYYVVKKGETLYRVSTDHNKVPIEELRLWNSIKGNDIAVGQKLIVGFLKDSDALMADDDVAEQKTTTQTQTTQVAKSEPKRQPEPDPKPVERSEPPRETREPESTPQQTSTMNYAEAGYFKEAYQQQARTQRTGKQKEMTAGIFKTTSGWRDAKFYMLIDGIQPGTIVRINNPSNHRAIYAKVLGEMAGIRQNKGLDIRISNAAASQLGLTGGDKFVVELQY